MKNIPVPITAKRKDASKFSKLKSSISFTNFMKKTRKKKPDAIITLSFFDVFLIGNTS
ncbi:hypothetical protein LYSIN_01482 [Lysinibacillus sphaericus]|uniref:Uncharacterized protein n=1 Tax=Lysinibacillus sphaericus TaxID=1421 RepID=A0A2S5D0U1_LYSSH|nr:hypothetical protein LYSIN_01482 [Lysinibacillus sphaericus]